MTDKTLHKIEQLGNQTLPYDDIPDSSNILVQYHVLRFIDKMMKNKLLILTSSENDGNKKSTSGLIYLVNNVFLLHDVFVGTPLA